MKHAITVMIAAVLAALGISTASADVSTASSSDSDRTSYKVTVDSLNIRSDAGTDHEITGSVAAGCTVTVIDTKDLEGGSTWAHITYEDSNGWVNMQYLDALNPPPAEDGWVYLDNVWQFYKDGEKKYSSNALYTAFTRIQSKSSSSSHYLVVDLNDYRVFAFEKGDDTWIPVKVMKCSIGKDGYNTPTGTFSVLSRWEVQKSESTWEYYPVQFLCNDQNSCSFTSIPYESGTAADNAGDAKAADETLETANTHGNITLSLDDIKWLYKVIENGTSVLIY